MRTDTMTQIEIVGTDCTFIAATPADAPELWAAYLEGARKAHRRFGCARTWEIDEIRDGENTLLFMVVFDDRGVVIAGARVQALRERHGLDGYTALQDIIANRIPAGVVEVKGVWVSLGSLGRKSIARALRQRTAEAAVEVLDVRYVLATPIWWDRETM